MLPDFTGHQSYPKTVTRHLLLVFGLTILFSGCTTPTTPPPVILPVQALLGAAEKPEGISGVFPMEIRGSGRRDGQLYLNSEQDYRDQRCLTIAIPDELARRLELLVGGDPAAKLKGKTIKVAGTAKRTTIWFISNGIRTDQYYYQTQVRVAQGEQISILP